MAIKFNMAKASENLMKMGSNFLQMGTLYGMSQSMNGCGRGGSIWGGGFGYGGGMGFGYGPMAPSPFLAHPMYGDMEGTNPYLTQMGLADAENYGAARAEYDMQQMAMRNEEQRELQMPRVPEGQNTELAEDFTVANKAGLDFKFTTDSWQELNKKENRTTEEQQKLDAEYKGFVVNLARATVANIDKSGNQDGVISKEEYLKYYKEQQPNIDSEKVENHFNNVDLNHDGVIDYTEKAALINLIDQDENGKVDGNIAIIDNQAASSLLYNENSTESQAELAKNRQFLFGN